MESCLDSVWGTGKTLLDANCLTPSQWIDGVGILGQILMRIRDSNHDTTMDSCEDETDDMQSVANEDEN